MSAAKKTRESPAPKRVDVHPHGLQLGDTKEIIPLWSGAMHYWRHAP
jgi:hypothetical protein